MSLPLHGDTIIKAIKGDEAAKARLIERLDQPAFTYIPPTLPKPSEEEATTFLTALAESHPKTLTKLIALCHL